MRQKFSWATSSPQARIDAITRKNELAYNTTRAVFTDTDGEGGRLLTTFLTGLRCSHGWRCVAVRIAFYDRGKPPRSCWHLRCLLLRVQPIGQARCTGGRS